jgi:hypothetical protein
MTPLSEQLAELSVRAKSVEDTMASAEKEAHDKIEVRKEQARAAASYATEKVDRELKSAENSAARNWDAVRAKVSADIASLKANIARAKHEHDVKRAENRANRLEWEASFAIDLCHRVHRTGKAGPSRCGRRPGRRPRSQASITRRSPITLRVRELAYLRPTGKHFLAPIKGARCSGWLTRSANEIPT